MRVVFYKTALCPRCHLASRALRGLQKEFPALEIETVEVAREPLRTWRDGVRMIPAVTCDGKTFSGVILTATALRKFLCP